MQKHNPNAPKLIDEYINSVQPFAQKICNKLRKLIKKSEPSIIEDWKWGPNYFKEGMVCGFGAFKEHVNFVFFQGAVMKDSHKLFNYGDANKHNRSIKFTDVKQIKDEVIIDYIKEAVLNNTRGIKSDVKEVKIPDDLMKELKKLKLINEFLNLPYTARKEWALLVTDAKKQETRELRILKIINSLKTKHGAT